MPWERSNFLVRLVVGGVTPLVQRGYRRRLEQTDLYHDPPQKIDKVRA